MSLADYKPHYHSVLSAGIALGYQVESLGKGELELRRSQVKVDNIGLTEGPIFISYKVKDQQESMKISEVNNDRIESTSIMANMYYHSHNGRFSFSPYVGVGLGATQTKMFEVESVDPAYQIKAGFSHNVSNSVSMQLGYSYFGVIGNMFKLSNVKSMLCKKNQCSKSFIDNLTLHSDFLGMHGIELSLRFLKVGDGGTFLDATKGDTIARIQYDDSTQHRYTLDLTEGKIQLKHASLDNSGDVAGTEKTFTFPKFLLNKLNDTFVFKTDLSDYAKTTDLNIKLSDYARTDGSNMTDDMSNKLMSHHTAQVFDFLSSLEMEYNAMHG
ncbi:Outer membrane protein/outer membrane enzyme PagP, beta-barrel,Surface antigen msp4 [Cinara cedri]|uniref:Outer membrane protein/outer membrane enzyme PagP, beta-barrel,Surface antigen msp4 n=1 Tax=Cinara cedri TaxID=506608 RepID=A0A5E4MU38_9HEMI|nr:Outer membrane protein/outer membrane enzyme PagP, beta-barrel,Surface antigen msp4 [Cinara cedri]